MAPPDALQTGDRFGRFEIRGRLGVGGMGEVYRAHDHQLERDIAIKVIAATASDTEWRHRFEREASSAAALAHPNICTVFEFGEWNGQAYIAMELVEGEDLAVRIHAGPLSVTEVIGIGVQIADALSEAARKGIVHRDLKSANVMVNARGHVKVLDFGLAKRTALDDAHTALTQTGAVMGTLAYMPPEQVRGQAVDHRSDLYSLGVILYELLTARRPFDGQTAGELAGAVLHQAPVAVERHRSEVPVELRRVVMRLLEKDPSARYQTADEVKAALTIAPPGTGPGFALPDWARSRHLKVAMVVSVIAVAMVFWLQGGGRLAGRASGKTPSLVILPAKVYGAPDFAYLSDAVPATLSNYLARVPGLDTRVPPTTEEIDRVGGDVAKVATAYKVDNALLTSVTADSAGLVYNIQLVDPATRTVVWSNEYSGSRAAYLQTMRTAADGIQAELVPHGAAAAPQIGNAATSEAELAFRTAEYHARRYTVLFRPEDFTAAYEAFSRALLLDPKLANAAAGIAQLHFQKIDSGQATEATTIPAIREWARRALAINPRTGRAWAALASAELGEDRADLDAMVTNALKAASFEPRCSECQDSISQALAGTALTVGLEASRQAHALDPLASITIGNLAMQLFSLGRSSEAEPMMAELRRMEPDNPWTKLQQAIIFADLGRMEEATALGESVDAAVVAKRMLPGAAMTARAAVALATAIHGGERTPELMAAVIAEVRAEVANPATSTWGRLMVQMMVTPFLVRSGHVTEAFELMAAASRLGTDPPLDWLMLDPRLEPLRKDQRFLEHSAGARTSFARVRQVLAEATLRHEVPPYLVEPIRALERIDQAAQSLQR